jgi:hypothetical protein
MPTLALLCTRPSTRVRPPRVRSVLPEMELTVLGCEGVSAVGPMPSFAIGRTYVDGRSEPREPGGQLRSCPPERAAPVPPPLLRCVAHPTPSAIRLGVLQPSTSSTAERIGSVGRAAERSKGGGVGRKPAPGEQARTPTVQWTVGAWRAPEALSPGMSAAACPGGPIPPRHPHGRRSTPAMGRERTSNFMLTFYASRVVTAGRL